MKLVALEVVDAISHETVRKTLKKTITRFNEGICRWCRKAAKVR